MKSLKKIFKWVGGILLVVYIGLAIGTGFISFRKPDGKWQQKFADKGIPIRFGYAGADSVHYAEAGLEDGPMVLLVHGSPGAWSAYNKLMQDSLLRSRFRMISPDRPGFGYTEYGQAEPNLERQASVLLPFLQMQAPGQKAILVGHSYGGPVIARMAIDYPELVEGIIFIGASIDPELEKRLWYNELATWLPIKLIMPEDMITSNQEILPLKPELEAMLPQWKDIRCKATVMHGANDRLVPLENAYFAERMLTNADTVIMQVVEGRDHFIPFTSPEVVREAIVQQADLGD